jgi:hypothetical protein
LLGSKVKFIFLKRDTGLRSACPVLQICGPLGLGNRSADVTAVMGQALSNRAWWNAA